MIRIGLLAVVAGFQLAVMAGPQVSSGYASSHEVFDAEEVKDIQRVVEDYLRNNPEVILDALRQMEQRQRLAEAEQLQRQIALDREALQNDPGSPVGGNPNGDVTVVEFFDYRCPYCKVVAPRLAQLLKDDGDVRFVYKEWPILGPVSLTSARAALAAWKQGKYAEFHDALMTVSGELSEKLIFDEAQRLGLDIDRLRKDMKSPEIGEILRRNAELAARLKINGTPAFVVGDELVPGAAELDHLKAIVEQVRSGG